MVAVRPPTSRVQIGYTDSGQAVWISTQMFDMLREILDRIGGEGDASLPTSLDAGSTTDNAVVRFSGTDGTSVQNSQVTVDDSGNVSVPGTVDGRDLSADGSKLDGIEAGAEVNDVDSVAGKTGAVTLDTDDVSEGSNLYFTDERAQDAVGGIVAGTTNEITTNYDDGANTLTIGLAGTLDFTGKTLSFPTENVALVDAGSAGATEQDWIEVTVGGNTGYLRVYAST